jgi:hypothetical protein
MIMRALLVAALALSVLAAVAGPSFAADDAQFPRDFWQQQQNNLP